MSESTPAQARRKMCTRCLEHRPVNEFSRRNDGYGGGYVAQCHSCRNAKYRSKFPSLPPVPAPLGDQPPGKMCTKCLKHKPLGEFGRRSDGGGGGHVSSCKECNNAHSRDSYWSKPSRIGQTRGEYVPPLKVPVPDGHRRCSTCRRVKPVAEFYRRSDRAGGLASACAACTRDYGRKRYQDMPEVRAKEKVRRARFRANNPDYLSQWIDGNLELWREYGRGIASRRRARKRDLPAEPYTLTQLIERDGQSCVLCGQPLNMAVQVPHPRAATVEHLECISWPGSAGDVLTNVAVSHFRCNVRRNDRPHPAAERKRAELLAVAAQD